MLPGKRNIPLKILVHFVGTPQHSMELPDIPVERYNLLTLFDKLQNECRLAKVVKSTNFLTRNEALSTNHF